MTDHWRDCPSARSQQRSANAWTGPEAEAALRTSKTFNHVSNQALHSLVWFICEKVVEREYACAQRPRGVPLRYRSRAELCGEVVNHHWRGRIECYRGGLVLDARRQLCEAGHHRLLGGSGCRVHVKIDGDSRLGVIGPGGFQGSWSKWNNARRLRFRDERFDPHWNQDWTPGSGAAFCYRRCPWHSVFLDARKVAERVAKHYGITCALCGCWDQDGLTKDRAAGWLRDFASIGIAPRRELEDDRGGGDFPSLCCRHCKTAIGSLYRADPIGMSSAQIQLEAVGLVARHAQTITANGNGHRWLASRRGTVVVAFDDDGTENHRLLYHVSGKSAQLERQARAGAELRSAWISAALRGELSGP